MPIQHTLRNAREWLASWPSRGGNTRGRSAPPTRARSDARGRAIHDQRVDTLRGLMLVIMTIDHLGPLSRFTMEPFGFVSAAWGFVFLSGYMVERPRTCLDPGLCVSPDHRLFHVSVRRAHSGRRRRATVRRLYRALPRPADDSRTSDAPLPPHHWMIRAARFPGVAASPPAHGSYQARRAIA
ncbi:OpgC domain-containing protein [Salinisphaera sp. Q1T1-3]|uniref:OpgC domain-containing protein n=1 Tax=Salinisphaera sp. Q1T1-3 TaxID=2321229 RepID=UPI000E74DEE9|nr:hypothetical protein D3260_08120 [Salinisphaera sp. Q1T1-3]